MAEVREDVYGNFLTGLGVRGMDKRLGAEPTVKYFDERYLSDLYSGDPMAKRICRLPAKEELRKWIKLRVDGGEEVAKKVTQRIDELDIRQKVLEARVWGRLYGDALLIIGADDGRPVDQPLNEGGIRTLQWLNVVDRYQLQVATPYTNPFAPKCGEPETYEVINQGNIVGANGQALGRRIHETRVIRFSGEEATRLRLLENNHWHDSIFHSLADPLRDFWTGFEGASALLSDFAVGVFKVKGFASMMGTKSEELLLKRWELVNMCKSILKAVVVDADHEEYARQQTPVTGYPELLDRLEQLVAGVTGIPVTLLMGRSPAGQNATGESDMRIWYDNVASEQDTGLRPKIERLLKLLFLSKDGPTGGREPTNWSFTFHPLQQPSEKEVVETRNKQATTDAIYIDRQVVTAEEVRMSRFGGDEYSIETTRDPAFDGLGIPDPDADEEDEEDDDEEA